MIDGEELGSMWTTLDMFFHDMVASEGGMRHIETPKSSMKMVINRSKPSPFKPVVAPCPKCIGNTVRSQYTVAHSIEYGISPMSWAMANTYGEYIRLEASRMKVPMDHNLRRMVPQRY